MEKSFLSVEVLGDNTKIECDGAAYLVATNIINQIAEHTDSNEEAINLYAYIKIRMSEYNDSLDDQECTDVPRGDLSPIMIKDILVSLLNRNSYDYVFNMLSSINDYDLFSSISLLERVTTEEAIAYLVNAIRDAYEVGGLYPEDEEEAYNNKHDKCLTIQLRRDTEEETDESTDKDVLSEGEEDITYEEKIEALLNMDLGKCEDLKSAHRLGLYPICK